MIYNIKKHVLLCTRCLYILFSFFLNFDFFISLKSVYIQYKVHIQFYACVNETMFRLEIQNEYG